MDEEIPKALGFESAAEFHRMIAAVGLSTTDRISAFKRWQNDDGRKAGLNKLPVSASEPPWLLRGGSPL